MPSSALLSYVARIRRYPRLSRSEERRLVQRLRTDGDRAAARTLVMAHLGLVVPIARSFWRLHPNVLELVQEGNLALIRAVHRYDPARPVTLAAYAASWVRTYIGRFVLANMGFVVEGDISSLRATIARDLHASVRSWAASIDDDDSATGEDAPEIDDPDLAAMALMVEETVEASDSQIEAREEEELLKAALPEFERDLTARERSVFSARFASQSPATLAQTGAKLGLSAERVRQIEQDLTDRLRTKVTSSPASVRARQAEVSRADPPTAAPIRQQRPSGNTSSRGDSLRKPRIVRAESERVAPIPRRP